MEKYSKLTPEGMIIKGYKATDKNMKCRGGFQFELGKWYEHDGELSLCNSGFHFCTYPSGPWVYYNDGLLFECEAEIVLLSKGPGAQLKHVAKKIRLTKAIRADRDGNVGARNVGDGNVGDGNGGDENTGNWNTGDGNVGDRNGGDGNTGDENTGNWNTGDGNVGDYHSGCLNHKEAKFYVFNKMARREDVDFELVDELVSLLMDDEEIDPKPFLSLPNATEQAIKELHEAHIRARGK